MDYKEIEKKMVAYKGPKIGFVLSGGGIGVAQLATVIGASKLIHSITIPYSYNESKRFILEGWRRFESNRSAIDASIEYAAHAVSERGAELLATAGSNIWGAPQQDDPCATIVCTAATTTSRYRQGDNHAWIGVVNPYRSGPGENKFFHLELSKLSEDDHRTAGAAYVAWKRRAEDREISDFIFNQVFEVIGRC